MLYQEILICLGGLVMMIQEESFLWTHQKPWLILIILSSGNLEENALTFLIYWRCNVYQVLSIWRVPWYPDLVEVFYHNLRFEDGIMKYRVKGVNIKIDYFIWMLFTGLEAKGALSHLPNSDLNMNLKKCDLYSNWRRFP